MNDEVVELYLDDIIPNRFQPREVFNDQALKELAISIREHGVIQPIIVRKFGEKYEIIAGERRYKASTMAGLTKIPAIVRNLDDKESSKVALIENLQRRDLTPIEEARTYQKILDLDEMTQEDLAKTMGKSQSAVSNKLRLLSLPDEVQEALLKEEISERHARSLLNVNDRKTQVDLLKEIIANKMTVRDLDSKIRELTGDTSGSSDEVTGGTANSVVEEKKEEINENIIPIDNNFPVNTASLFEKVDKSSNITTNDFNNSTNSAVSVNAESNIVDNNTSSNLTNVTESLFDSVPDSFNNVDNINYRNLNNDPTVVDINKIRENSTDLSPLINRNNDGSPNMNDLLSADRNNNIDTNINTNTSLFDSSDNRVEENNSNTLFNSSTQTSSLFNEPKTENNTSDLFYKTPLPNSVNDNANAIKSVVEDVKKTIIKNQNNGCRISFDELELDKEIQLIVRFYKD